MKRLVLCLAVLAAFSVMMALPAFECANEGDAVHMVLRTQAQQDGPVVAKTVAIPWTDATIDVRSMHTITYDGSGNQVATSDAIENNRVRIAKSFIMREMRGYTVQVEMEQTQGEFTSVIDEIDFTVEPAGSYSMPTHVSEAFLPVYKTLASNYETSYLPNLPLSTPHMLIIGHNLLASDIPSFIAWKRSRGMDITYVTKESISSNATNEVIRTWIANFYHESDNPPDYLLLIGDVVNTFTMPTFYTTAESNVADIPYTMIDGNDYLPEMIVGRFSIQSLNDYRVIANKTISYESSPLVGDWMERTLVVAGNYSDLPPIPVTPVLMSRWLHDKMLNYGYAQADTVFYPPTYPGTSAISNYINNGVQFASYRGWGAADGWHFPLFHYTNVQATTSGRKMPIVTSIVCNTGDFGNTANSNTCFGEVWMRLGTPSTPNGCVAFVGPSDLHTSTEDNNAISSGFYHGVFDEDIRSFGSAVLRGKAELYNNYPNNLEVGDEVEFYFWVYNILSDPSLNMWVRTPEEIYSQTPNSITQGTNYIEYTTLPAGTVVTATRDYTTFTKVVSEGGTTILPIDTSTTGSLYVNVWNKFYIPNMTTVNVVASDNVGVEDWSVDSEVQAGETTTLSVTAHNYGEALDNLTASISSTSEWFEPSNGMLEYGAVSADGSATANVEFGVAPGCPDDETIIIDITFSTGDMAKITVPVTSILFEVASVTVNDGGNGILDPGETTNIVLGITNIGTIAAQDINVALVPSIAALTVNSSAATITTLTVGETAEVTFNVTAAADCYRGREGRFQVQLTSEDRPTYAYAYLTIGEVDNTVPTGPDDYGYYCYDNNDTAWEEAPDYDWHVIDPREGGPGTLHVMFDDNVVNLDLPFDFRFYGNDYDEITVCSNGWVAFGDTWQADFRNWRIPAALGPDAFIAAYWDDLKGHVTGDSMNIIDTIRVVSYYSEADNELILQWNDAYNQCNNSSIERFEVILKPRTNDDGDIYVNYHTVDNPDTGRNYCTIGLQNQNHTDGLLYSYANIYPESASPLTAGLALHYCTTPPDDYVGTHNTEESANGLVLRQNHPNPFNPQTTIGFNLANAGKVRLDVYNVRGQRVATLANGVMDAGEHQVTWQGTDDNGRAVSSGVYMYRLRTGDQTLMRRMLLLK